MNCYPNLCYVFFKFWATVTAHVFDWHLDCCYIQDMSSNESGKTVEFIKANLEQPVLDLPDAVKIIGNSFNIMQKNEESGIAWLDVAGSGWMSTGYQPNY